MQMDVIRKVFYFECARLVHMPEISAQYSYNAFHPQKGFTSASPRNAPAR